MDNGSITLGIVLDKISNGGICAPYQRQFEHQCYILEKDESWYDVKHLQFNLSMHELELDCIEIFLKKCLFNLTKNGCLMMVYVIPIDKLIKFGLIYFPNITFMSFDDTTNMAHLVNLVDAASYITNMVLVDEVMDD